MPIFTSRSGSTTFRVRWRGYDRAEVDAFLRRTEADRQRLQEDLAQIGAVMASRGEEQRRELERLAALRADVAGCLETSISALRKATERLGVESAAGPLEEPTPVRSQAPGRVPKWKAALTKRRLVAAAAAAVVLMVGAAYQYQPRAIEMPQTSAAAPATSVVTSAAAPLPAPAPAEMSAAEGLVLTLTAKRECWIGTSIDGAQRLERMLKPNETIMLRANEAVVLRAGDADALDVLINNEPMKPLGARGQVVSARITRANYRDFLSSSAD